MITLENDELIFRFPEVQLLRKGSSANALTTGPLVGVGSLDRRRRDVRSLHGSAYGAQALQMSEEDCSTMSPASCQ
jgi:hypothetical protein